MILRSPAEDENRHGLALTVILNAVKDLLYVFDPLETDNKQILRRGVYPEHGRRAPQNDIATSQDDRRQAYNSNFRRSTRRTRRIWKLIFPNLLSSCSSRPSWCNICCDFGCDLGALGLPRYSFSHLGQKPACFQILHHGCDDHLIEVYFLNFRIDARHQATHGFPGVEIEADLDVGHL
jgi:hypothetical protein